ncbi:MAG: hypothetical protein WBA45_03055 [Microthrixaceae bacterium]
MVQSRVLVGQNHHTGSQHGASAYPNLVLEIQQAFGSDVHVVAKYQVRQALIEIDETYCMYSDIPPDRGS